MRIDTVQAMTAEKSALGAALLDAAALARVVEGLVVADFQNEANRAIFKAMKKMHGEGKPVDFATLFEEVGDDEHVRRIGKLDYLLELSNFLPSAVNVESYINSVTEYGRESRITDAMRRIAISDDPALPQLDRLIADERAAIKSTGRNPAEVVAEYLDELCDGGEKALFTTGFPKFDEHCGGLPRGSISCLAARPRVGKTALALNIMTHNIYSGYNAAYFSLEMTVKQLLDRIGASTSGVPYGPIFRRKLERGQQAAVGKELVDLTGGNRLNLYDNIRSCNGIVAEARRIGADLIFIDYIQRVRPDERRTKRNEEIEEIIYRLKDAAIALSCHICILSQIGRQGADKPTIQDLKESGALEEGSDIIMLLHRKSENEGRILLPEGSLIVGKHKYGQEGYISIYFDGNRQKFQETAKEAR
jgi:replicative DNA helicase